MFNPTMISEVAQQNQTNENYTTTQKVMADLMGEFEAIIQYNTHIAETNSEIGRRTWTHIRNEELHHIGELLGLLEYLSPVAKTHIAMGKQEFLNSLNSGLQNDMPQSPMFGSQNNMQ